MTRRRTAPDTRSIWSTDAMFACGRAPHPWEPIAEDLDAVLAPVAARHPEHVARFRRVVLRYGPTTLRECRQYGEAALAELDRLDAAADAKEAGTYSPHDDYARHPSGAPRFRLLPGHMPASARDMHRITNNHRRQILAWLADLERTRNA